MERKSALVIAGFDPSGGAGVLSDVAIFANNKVDTKVCITCNTAQNFKECFWVEEIPGNQISDQLNRLLESFAFDGVKIGAFPDLKILDDCLESIKSQIPDVPVVWDPVIKATKGAAFVSDFNKEVLLSILKKVTLIAPNKEEYNKISSVIGAGIETYTSTLITSYHETDTHITDRLFTEGEILDFPKEKVPDRDIHGSGCKYSAWLTAHLIAGCDLKTSVSKAGKAMFNLYQRTAI